MNQLLLLGSWWGNIFKNLTFLLDKGVYMFVQAAYEVFYNLADISLLEGTDIIQNITTRIYTLLSIVMVFVLAFNLLNYIVDPDKITDKKIGASAFIKDVIISLAVIALTPLLFTKLYALQGQILSSNVLASLILGGNSSKDVEYDKNKYDSLTQYYVRNGANTMVSSIYVAFLYPNDGFIALDCHAKNVDQEKLTKHQDYCDAYDNAMSGKGINAFSDFITNDDYTYTPLITTVAGIVLLFFMLSFCINLAKRVGKLAILQFLAPIPMALELIPSKKGLRKNWFDTLIKVYLEAFFFLAVMYVIVLLISLVPGVVLKLFGEATQDVSLLKLITTVLLIYGLLAFGKEAPQMVFDLLGIKSTGVIKEAALRALKVPSVTREAAATIGDATVGRFARNFNATNGNLAQKALSGVGGVLSGGVRQLWGARNVHSVADARKLRQNVNQNVITARVNRDAYAHAHGDKLGSILGGHVQDAVRSANLGVRGQLGADNTYQATKATEQTLRDYKKLYNDGVASIWKNDSKWQAYNAELMRATAAGDTTAMTNAQAKLDARKKEVLKENKLKLMEAAGKLNNFMDAHQGVTGISKTHINLADIGAIASDADAQAQLDALEAIVVDSGVPGGDGFKQNLKDIEANVTYQQQRVQEKLREDAKQSAKKAAEDANKSGGDKK